MRQYKHTREQSDIDVLLGDETESQEALRETISLLILERELLRDLEIEQLIENVEELEKKVADQKREIMLEELRCFKEVMQLHKKLIEKNDR